MKRMRSRIICMMCLCMMCGTVLSACGQEVELPDIMDSARDFSTHAMDGGGERTDGTQARELTEEEIKFFDDYCFLPENMPFLLTTYSSSEEAQLNDDGSFRIFNCMGGTVEGDVYTLRMRTKDAGTGYRSELYETVLRKSGDTYQFLSNRLMEGEGRIEDQSFEITLPPWGKVTFASYMPEEDGEPTADVTFRVIQDGRILMTLDGVYNDNIRPNHCFLSVDAVSFPDIDGDGHMDLITIVSYDYASGPDVGTGYTEARIYSGSESGYFVYERKMSEDANSALAELTVGNVLSFLGAGKGQASAGGQTSPDVSKDTTSARTGAAWKDAYIEVLKGANENEWSGFALIYLDDDDVPELVMAGEYAARGNVLVAYTEGGVKENQLDRLNFSYIERGNQLCNSEGLMDYYYDLVYTLRDGQLVLTDEGYYGAEDNSNVKFDENGEPVYQYKWNGKIVTKDEYAEGLKAAYDLSKAQPGYIWNQLYSAEELIRELSR